MNREVQGAYRHLQALSEREGKHEQAQLYAYLASQEGKKQKDHDFPCYWCDSGPGGVSRWNGFLVETSGLALLFSAGLLLACVFTVMVRGRSLRLGSLRPGRLTLMLGVCGSAGLLLASSILYVSYKPYEGIFQRYLHTGDESEMGEFINFLSYAQDLPLSLDAVRFWLAVTVLCVIALFLVLTRSLIKHLRARGLDPRMVKIASRSRGR